MAVIFICASRPVREGWPESAAFGGLLSIGALHSRLWELPMSLRSVLLVSALAVALAAELSWAAEDPLEKPLYQICLQEDVGWIGKSEKEIEANCACKAKTEASLASPEFREDILKKGVYEGGAFPFGDFGEYQKRVLTDCPALRPRMVEAMCNDPAAPPDCRSAVEDMIRNLK